MTVAAAHAYVSHTSSPLLNGDPIYTVLAKRAAAEICESFDPSCVNTLSFMIHLPELASCWAIPIPPATG